MKRTDRRFFLGALATGAVASAIRPAALPSGAIAAALPASTGEEQHPRWNTPERLSVDEDPRPRPEHAWYANGWLFVDTQGIPGPERHTQRKVHINVHTDGSMRIAFFPVDPSEHLNFGRGFTAINIAPDLAAEVWGGVFAKDDDDALPVTPFKRKPWSDDAFRQHQRTIHRRDLYADTEEHVYGDDGARRNMFAANAERDDPSETLEAGCRIAA